MLNPTPAVSCRYGAPLGRSSDHLAGLIVEPADTPFTLRRVRLNSGGYDDGGAYWGIGAPLFWWAIEIREGESRDECSGYFRARDRAAAKAHIRGLHPAARFYR
jgi:hypothetical protein